MLEPSSRRLLLESLQPPADHRLDCAVGTTYSLDLMALLSAPVAFAFSDWQDREGRPTLEPLALLKAVRQYADRICLFCQAGKIHVPRTYQPLLANLEDSIVQANAPRGGSFHPKLWFLRYIGADDSVMYRLLCLSRNMTFDRSWDTMLCLEGQLTDRANAFKRNHPLGEFVEALPTMAPRGLAPQWRKRFKDLAYELRRVGFDVPEPFEEMNFWPLGAGDRNTWPFPTQMDRLLVISPFVDDGLLSELAEHEAPMQLVSRPESLAQLELDPAEYFGNTWVLDDTAEPDAAEMEEETVAAADDGNGEPIATPGDPVCDIPLVGLHAKLFVADTGWQAHVWTGSANATQAAFKRNVEFLVELSGKRSRCGVAAVLGQSEEDGKPRAACLADLLRPYVHRDDDEAGSPEERAFERMVDALARGLAATVPVAACEPLESPDCYAVTVRGTRPGPIKLAAGCRLQARPISLPAPHLREVAPTEPSWVRFEPVSLLGLTSFFAFELTSADQRLTRQFVLNIPLENAPDHRHERILRDLLSDQDRVLRFLLLLLMDHGARDFGVWFGDPGNGDGKSSFVHSMFQSTLFESLVRALDRDPERIDQVAQVIEDLRKTPEGQGLLPGNLDAIWQPILQVRQRQLAREHEPRRPNS